MNTVYNFLSKLILEPYSMLFFFDIGLTVSYHLLEWCNGGDKLRWINSLGDVVYCYLQFVAQQRQLPSIILIMR